MPSWLVFCTTQVPAKVIEKFQDQSTLSWLAPDDPWILQKTPEGGIRGPYLACPVASFTTGFENASPEYLQSFTEESIKDKTEFPGLNFNDICSDTFVILDKRSLEDGTCEVYHRFQKSAPGFEFAVRIKETPLVDEWKSWRVRFVTSWFMCNGLWFNDGFIEELMPKYGGLYIDDKGVLQMAYIEQDTYQLEDWEDRAPWGPGGPPPQS